MIFGNIKKNFELAIFEYSSLEENQLFFYDHCKEIDTYEQILKSESRFYIQNPESTGFKSFMDM